MFALNAVEGFLPFAPAYSGFNIKHIRESDFPHDPMMTINSLFKHTEKRAFSRCKKYRYFLVWIVLRVMRTKR